jgi:hypothetical protein
MITIFSEPPQSTAYPTTFVVSILVHGSLLGLLTFNVVQSHRIIERFPETRYALRVVDFHSKEPQSRQSAGGGIVYRGPQPAPRKLAQGGSSGGSPTITRQTAELMPAPQTLVQPDLPKETIVSPKIPVPMVVLWTPDKVAPKKIVPALPGQPTISVVHPSLDTPIKEETVADLRISSTNYVTQTPAPQPSTTSPIVVHGPEEARKVPQTTSKQPESPTPARVVSLSDIRMVEGSVAVPQANQSVSKSSPGAMVPGQLKDPSHPANGNAASDTPQTGVGKGSGERSGNQATGSGATQVGNGDPASKDGKSGASQGSSDHGEISASPGSAAQSGAASGQAQGAAAGSGSGNQLTSVHISLPRDGQFGVVVFGSSIEERFPETAELWSGRMASTVYLHVGLPKNWILQYALPRIVDAAAAGGGHLDAPWPFEIVRPNIDPADLDTDALILHGFVSKDGHFEKLQVIFPPQFVQAPMVLNVLNQWQFRPAKLNGIMTAVEVLLIIPDQSQ